MSDPTDNRFYREKQEQPSSNQQCEHSPLHTYDSVGRAYKAPCPWCLQVLVAELSRKLADPVGTREPPHCPNCGCGLPPAAPQSLNKWFCSLPAGRQAVLAADKWMLAEAAHQAGRAAQLEPIPPKELPVDRATWAQALDIIGQLAEHGRCEDDEWVAEGRRFFDQHAPSLTKSGSAP